MNKIKIDLLREKYNLQEDPRRPYHFLGRVLLVLLVVATIGGAVFSYQVTSSGDGSGLANLFSFSTIKQFVQSGDRQLKGEENDRINFLLTGIGGTGHDGPQLTDTMIFSSLKPSTGEIGMISIPRDMTVPIPDHGWRKINHANAFGENKEPGYGPLLAKEVIENVLAQDVHYYVRVDFDGFAKLIDDIGGIDVYVDNAFTDYEYPSHGMAYANCGTSDTILDEEGEEIRIANYNCRFEVLSFQEGWIHMDGDTALKFVRSRHGTNGEASDFARSRRQQKILLAVKEKAFSISTFLNPSRINKVLNTLQDNIATNLDVWEMIQLAKKFKDLDSTKIVSHVLDSSPESPLYATSLNGAYVLLPKNDDWRPVQNMALNIFDEEGANIIESEMVDDKPHFVKVEIQNGTNISGLAFNTAQLLDGQGFEVIKVGNAAQRGYTHTVIYDLTDGQRPDELMELTDFLEAKVTLSTTGWIVSGDIIPKEISLTTEDFDKLATEDNIDFLVILGENSASLVQR